MQVTNMAKMLVNKYQMQKQKNGLQSQGNPVPAKDYVNPYEDPYLDITGKSPSEWQKIVPVDDEVADKLRSLIKEDFVKRNGMCGDGKQADAQANIIKDYIKTLPGEQKLAAIYSCEQIAFKEADRLIAKIREQNPSWQSGQPFDTSILENDKGFDILA